MRVRELVLLISLLIVLALGESTCPKVSCLPESSNSSLCINLTNHELLIQTCPHKNQICPLPTIYTDSHVSCEPPYENTQLAAGEPCLNGEECTTGACNTSSHLCYGFPHGMNCDLTSQCEIGTYCHDGK